MVGTWSKKWPCLAPCTGDKKPLFIARERDGPRLAVSQHFARVPRPQAPSQMPKKVPSIFSKTFSYQQRLIFMMDDLSWEESLPVFRESAQVRKYRHMFTHFHIKCFYFHEFNFNLWTVESLDWHSLRKTEIIWTPRVSPWVGGGEGETLTCVTRPGHIWGLIRTFLRRQDTQWSQSDSL